MISSSVIKLIIKAKDEASKVLSRVGSRLEKAGWNNEKLARTARIAGTAITGMATVIGGLAVKTAANLEQAVANAVSVTGKLGDEADVAKEKVSELAKILGQETAFTATQAAEAMYVLASAGRDVTNMAKSDLIPMLDLAAATQSDLKFTTETMNQAISAMNLTFEDSKRIADVFTKGITSSQLRLEDLSEAMIYAAPVAHSFNQSLEQTVAALGLMANAGFKGSMAGTALRGALSRLADVSGENIERLKSMNLSIAEINPTTNDLKSIMEKLGNASIVLDDKLKTLVDSFHSGQITAEEYEQQFEKLAETSMTASNFMSIFGLRAGPAMLALISQGTDAMEKLIYTTEDAGLSSKIAADQLNTLGGKMMLLRSSVEGILIALGDKFLPLLTSLANKLMIWINNNKKLATIILTVTVAILGIIGPILLLLGFLPRIIDGFKLISIAVSGLGKALIWLTANPIGLILVALALLGVAIYMLIKHWDEIKEATLRVWNAISKFLINIWNNIKETALTTWNAISNFFKIIWDTITQPFKIAINFIVGLIDWWLKKQDTNIKFYMEAVKDIIKSVWNFIKNIIKITINTIIDIITAAGEIIKTIWQAIWDAIYESVQNKWDMIKRIVNFISPYIRKIFNIAKAILLPAWEAIWNPIKDSTESFVTWVKDKIGGMLDWVSDKLEKLKNAITEAWNSVKGFFSSVTEQGAAITGFAQGGIVTKPTMGIVGESGPEAVIPLNKTQPFSNINVNITGTFLSETAAEEVGDMVINKLKENVRI